MSDLRERIKEARELCELPGSYGTLAVVRRKLDEMLSVPEAKPRKVTDEDAREALHTFDLASSKGAFGGKAMKAALEAYETRRKR